MNTFKILALTLLSASSSVSFAAYTTPLSSADAALVAGLGGSLYSPEPNEVIVFGAGGAITTSISDQSANYDGSEDQWIAVINDSGTTLNSFNITGNFIFGFDGDGIDAYKSGSNSTDTSGYGGPLGYFTNINGYNSGTVNFIGGLATGGVTYFSLEESATLSAQGGIVVTTTSVPEPEMISMFTLGLLGLGVAARKKA